MTEDEAQNWILDKFGAEAHAKMTLLVDIVSEEANHQNLISSSTIGAIWARHVVDSAQLILLAETSGIPHLWLDIGTGAGFPGLVVAALRDYRTTLVEPRRKRAAFLERTAVELGLADHTTVMCSSIEAVTDRADVISARAFAKIDQVLAFAVQCSTCDTVWILPKGRHAREEVASAREAWHGVFHVEHSITDPESLIVIASEVSRR